MLRLLLALCAAAHVSAAPAAIEQRAITVVTVHVNKSRPAATPTRTVTVVGPAVTITINGPPPANTPAPYTPPAYNPPSTVPSSSGYTGAALAPLTAQLSSFYALASASRCAIQLDTLAGGFVDGGPGIANPHYCGDRATSPSVVWWKANMDVDCDGGAMTGACGNDPSHQSQTNFEFNGRPMDAQAVPYVVINDQSAFSPARFGFAGLDVVGVICNGQLTWAVFGDTNGASQMGEGSLRLAQNCFGPSMTGDNGHGAPDVVYFAFPGTTDQLGGYNYAELAAHGNSLLPRLNTLV